MIITKVGKLLINHVHRAAILFTEIPQSKYELSLSSRTRGLRGWHPSRIERLWLSVEARAYPGQRISPRLLMRFLTLMYMNTYVHGYSSSEIRIALRPPHHNQSLLATIAEVRSLKTRAWIYSCCPQSVSSPGKSDRILVHRLWNFVSRCKSAFQGNPTTTWPKTW